MKTTVKTTVNAVAAAVAVKARVVAVGVKTTVKVVGGAATVGAAEGEVAEVDRPANRQARRRVSWPCTNSRSFPWLLELRSDVTIRPPTDDALTCFDGHRPPLHARFSHGLKPSSRSMGFYGLWTQASRVYLVSVWG